MPYSTQNNNRQIKVFVLFPDGKLGYHYLNKDTVLSELQNIVGGYIQLCQPFPMYIEAKDEQTAVVYTHESMQAQLGEYFLVVNEEGIIDRLPPNAGVANQLLGTVVLCPVSAL
jgi:hypothetical protein